ncbi:MULTISPECIES: hypothetical protein, partial [unclassified Mesorhizobium]|uniref:hypothetical protein n=1 Tax=unclassified Mesorhizobium TaxID=325217 RepID=UPI00333762E2
DFGRGRELAGDNLLGAAGKAADLLPERDVEGLATDTYCRVCRLRDTLFSAWVPAARPVKSLGKIRKTFLF